MAEYSAEQENGVAFELLENDKIKVQMHLDGKPGNWIEFDLEQMNDLIKAAWRSRDSLILQVINRAKGFK